MLVPSAETRSRTSLSAFTVTLAGCCVIRAGEVTCTKTGFESSRSFGLSRLITRTAKLPDATSLKLRRESVEELVPLTVAAVPPLARSTPFRMGAPLKVHSYPSPLETAPTLTVRLALPPAATGNPVIAVKTGISSGSLVESCTLPPGPSVSRDAIMRPESGS